MEPWDSHQREVEQVFKFTAEDIAANEQGRITPDQLRRAKVWRWHMIKDRGSVALVFLVLAVIGAVFFVLRTGEIFILLGALSLIGLLIGGFSVLLQVLSYSRAIRRAQLQSVTALSDLQLVKTRYGMLHLLNIDREEFTLSEAQHTVLWDGQMYTIYYLAGTGRILSIKTLPDSKPGTEPTGGSKPSAQGEQS